MQKQSHFLSIAFAITAASLLGACASTPEETPQQEPTPQVTPSTQETKPVETPQETVFSLIQKGDSAQARSFFKGRADLEGVDAQGRTALILATEKGDVDLVGFLLSLGAKTEARNKSGKTALLIACEAKAKEIIAKLAAAGADPFAADETSRTPAALVIQAGGTETAALATKDNVNLANTEGNTLLHLATKAGVPEAVEALLEKGAKPSMRNKAGKTALDLAYDMQNSLKHAECAEKIVLAGGYSSNDEFTYFAPAVRNSNWNIRFEGGLAPLHFAAAAEQLGYLDFMLTKGADPQVKSASGATPLHEALRNGKIEAAKHLIAAKADVNARDAQGNSPLHLVMPLEARMEGVKLLLASGADPNVKDNHGDAPLHVVVTMNMDPAVLKALIEGKADVDIRNLKGKTALSLAAEYGRDKLVPVLLEGGANIFAADDEGKTPFDAALATGGALVSAFITPKTVGARDDTGATPLHVAVATGASPSIVASIIEAKADVVARDKAGDTPLHIAVRKDLPALGTLLIANGADIFATNSSGASPLKLAATNENGFQTWILTKKTIDAKDGLGNSILHYAALWRLNDAIPIIIEKGCAVDARNATGETALFNAVRSDSPDTVTVLSTAGANLEARDALGNTAMHAAVRWNVIRCARALVQAGADASARNLSGKTPLHDAVRLGMANFESFLITQGADIEARDLQGATPLMEAIDSGSSGAVERLMDRGASPVSRDNQGRTALHRAVEARRVDIATILLSKGASVNAQDGNGDSPLRMAITVGGTIADALVTKDRVGVADDEGKTPLLIALEEDASEQLLESFLSRGARVNARDALGRTALHYALAKSRLDFVKILAEAGADPFAEDAQGTTATGMALTQGAEAVAALFGPKTINAQDAIGNTVLHYVARMGTPENATQLIALGASPNVRNASGEIPLQTAVRWKRGPQFAKVLSVIPKRQ